MAPWGRSGAYSLSWKDLEVQLKLKSLYHSRSRCEAESRKHYTKGLRMIEILRYIPITGL
jgi:hypothetical protein